MRYFFSGIIVDPWESLRINKSLYRRILIRSDSHEIFVDSFVDSRVDSCVILVAIPSGFRERVRSGGLNQEKRLGKRMILVRADSTSR